MRIAAIYLPKGSLPEIFGAKHNELTINLGGANIYTVRRGVIAKVIPNEFYLDDIFDSSISLLSCIVGGNGGGKTTLLQMIATGYFQYVIEYPNNGYKLLSEIEIFHRVYYTPYLNQRIINSTGNNGKDLSKLAMIYADNEFDSKSNNDLLEAHFSENSKRWIRFNHFYSQLPWKEVSLPVFKQVVLSIEHFNDNNCQRQSFNDTSSKLQPVIRLLFKKIKEERHSQEMKISSKRLSSRTDKSVWIIRFEYALYESALGKLVSILERAGNRYLHEGRISKDYEEIMGPMRVRDAMEWFLKNASVYRKFENKRPLYTYSFSQNLSLIKLIDYVLSLLNKESMKDNWREIVIHESKVVQLIELYDNFIYSFNNDWFNYDAKPLFSYVPQINPSSGEQQFLNLFSTLYDHATNRSGNEDIDLNYGDSVIQGKEDILLLLDEGDNAFHPQWKKEYVRYLRKILPIIFKGCNIQILFSTHDPLTLSDIPKNNVVYFEKAAAGSIMHNSSERRTFGANVSDMLKDSFFLKDGQVGSFVAGEIKAIIEKINQAELPNVDIVKIERIIHAIDEPIIKFKLAQMLGQKIGSNRLEMKFIDDEISRLKKRQNELQ